MLPLNSRRLLPFAFALLSTPGFAQTGWKGDFESGDLSQWSYVLNEAGLSVVQDPVLAGQNAAQIRISDQELWSNGLNRVELQHLPDSLNAEGSEIYFGWSLYLPEALTSDDHQLGYWETNETYQQVMSLHATGQDLSFNTNLGGYKQHWQAAGVLTPGVWHRIVFHIKWSREPSAGEVSLWFDGAKVVDAVKVRTYGEHPAFVQLGVLRDTISKVETLFVDEALEGTSYEAVALTATLPVTPPPASSPAAPTAAPSASAAPLPPASSAPALNTAAPVTSADPNAAPGSGGESKNSGCALSGAHTLNSPASGVPTPGLPGLVYLLATGFVLTRTRRKL